MTETRWVPKVGDTVWISAGSLGGYGIIRRIVRRIGEGGYIAVTGDYGQTIFHAPDEYHATEREAAARALRMAEEELEAAWAMIDELEKARDRYAAMAGGKG